MTQRFTGNHISNLAVASASIATEVSITATSSATGNLCMTIGPFAVDGGQYRFVWFTPYLTKGTTNLDVELFEGSTLITSLSGHMTASAGLPGATYTAVVTLSQGNHTLKITAFVDGGTGKFGANNGATGNAPNAWAMVIPL